MMAVCWLAVDFPHEIYNNIRFLCSIPTLIVLFSSRILAFLKVISDCWDTLSKFVHLLFSF